MSESFGGAFIIKLILVFIVIYITFMGVAVNYAKVFRVKNHVINIVEQNQFDIGVTKERQDMYRIVDTYLSSVPYDLNGNLSLGMIVLLLVVVELVLLVLFQIKMQMVLEECLQRRVYVLSSWVQILIFIIELLRILQLSFHFLVYHLPFQLVEKLKLFQLRGEKTV